MAPRIYTRLKLSKIHKEPILDIIKRWERLSADELAFLQGEVRFVIITIPEALAVEQLENAFQQLDRSGLIVDELIINNVVEADDSPFLKAKANLQKRYIEYIHLKYADLPITEVPMFPYELKGWDKLKEVEKILFSDSPSSKRLRL